jgi:hypothetical protein
MPKKAKELTGLAVAKLKTEGSYAVGGLTVCISGFGSVPFMDTVLQWESE